MTRRNGTKDERLAGVREGLRGLRRAMDRIDAEFPDSQLEVNREYGKSNYICPNCYKQFYDIEEFIEHQKQHGPEAKEQLMICPNKECKFLDNSHCSHNVPHMNKDSCPETPRCPACIPYEPEEYKVRVSDSLPNNLLGINGIYYQQFATIHKATKVIDSGFMCPECGKWFSDSAMHKEWFTDDCYTRKNRGG